MGYFSKILDENSKQCIELEKTIRSGLENSNFEPLIDSMKPVLEELYSQDKIALKNILRVLEDIHQYPKEDWGTIFTLLMGNAIGKTETGDTAFFDTADFPWVEEVEALYSSIKSEFELANGNIDLLPAFQEFNDQQQKLSSDDKWKVLVFKFYGENIEESLAHFPATAKLLGHIPGWTTGMFSILKPGKIIPPHDGPYKGVLRYHLGLNIPENCAIEVKGEVKSWKEGGSLIFDDTFTHSAWNKSDKDRSVLFVDFIRPLPFPLNILNEWVICTAIHDNGFLKGTTHKSSFQRLFDGLDSTS